MGLKVSNAQLIGITALACVIAATAAISIVLLWGNQQWFPHRVSEVRITFQLPKNFEVRQLQKTDEEAKVYFRAEAKKPYPMLFTLRIEEGLRGIAALTRQEMIPMLIGNLEKAYPQRFPGFKKISDTIFDGPNGRKTGEVHFVYKGPKGELIRQRLWIVDRNGSTAVYVSAQVKASDYKEADNRYLNKLFGSITLYEPEVTE